jgi:integrase
MRPGEAVSLREDACTSLPDTGWGLLLLTGNAPRVGSTWTDSGTNHDERHLKHRAGKVTRPVPIPPELVAAIRSHVARFGTAPDGRRSAAHGESCSARTPAAAPGRRPGKKPSPPAQARSPLAGRPYDLRHSGVTLQLNAGVPAPEIARRAGHGVAVLLRVYAGCIDGQEQLWNGPIDYALRDDDTP